MADDNANDLSDQIADAAAGPQQVTGDQGSMTQRPIGELIEADRYLSAKRAMRRGIGIRRVRLIPPSAADVDFRR